MTIRIAARAAARFVRRGIAGTASMVVAVALAAPCASLAQEGDTFPTLTGRVVDAANLLDATTVERLDTRLAAHETASSDQVVVVTVPSLGGRDIADYANRLGRAWGIGTAENDNGVLLVVAPNERDVRIEVGYGLEGALTDALAANIVRREILPAFREGDYAGGIDAGTGAILAAIEGEYAAPPAGSSGTGRDRDAQGTIGGILPLFFIAMVALPQLLRRLGAERLAGGAFPAGFAGLFTSLMSNSLVVGVLVAIAVFAFFWFNGGSGTGGGTRTRRRRLPGVVVGGGGFGGGGFGGGGFGGGFGGGGGSFGGGGASGSW